MLRKIILVLLSAAALAYVTPMLLQPKDLDTQKLDHKMDEISGGVPGSF